eukprot:12725108-Alexandrium_andersonii.AAC.1
MLDEAKLRRRQTTSSRPPRSRDRPARPRQADGGSLHCNSRLAASVPHSKPGGSPRADGELAQSRRS